MTALAICLVVLGAALTITFAIFCTIYYFVPKGHIPWHGVWPGLARRFPYSICPVTRVPRS